MRITTNQVLQNYQSNLSKSTKALYEAENRVLTGRKFSTASEDPASASTAYKLRKEYLDTEVYIENTETATSHLEAVESSTMEISTIAKQAKALILQGISDTSSTESRATIAASLREMQESIVSSSNAKLGDTFLFGGQTTDEVPFELVDGQLQYYGLDVSSTDSSVQAQLKEMENAKIYVDLGFGLAFEDGDVVNNSAFNTAFSGLTSLGYGQTEGMDNNIVNLLGTIADEFEKDPIDSDTLDELSLQFDDCRSNVTDFLTVLGTKSTFLESTLSRLGDTKTTLNDKIVSVEKVDSAEAITDLTWTQYAYNAALKVGNSILSQSFIDFMS
ncbi:MAG: hypothetical protein EOM28_11710 [Clostridia bacterium]|nr:hypothetical protein [Anaerotignum sp.]NCC16983.1 hypothetical protein [Clostridia bacterium]